MTFRLRLSAAAFAALLAFALPQCSRADDVSAVQRGEIEKIVHDYLVTHPEVLQEAMAELEKRQTAAESEKHKAAVKEHARRCSPRPTRSRSAIRTATSPSSSSSITTAATASAP